jgi:two-component system chemotaxis response regulator CheB
MSPRRIITIGGSLGGVAALHRLAGLLPADLGVPVVAVQHIGIQRSRLPELLGAVGHLSASHVVDGEPLRAGHLHIAPPDHHVLVEGDLLRLTKGPKEHHTRPAIDPLFRSVALSHGPGAVGVVLTGGLDDGTAGLQAIKDAGGIAVVQEPSEAEEPSMPLSALRYVRVDHRVRLGDMGALLATLVRQEAAVAVDVAPADSADSSPANAPTSPTSRWRHEHELSRHQGSSLEHLNAIATPSTFVCPSCQGSLWQVKASQPVRFVCHTGHVYSLRSLQHAQAQATDAALWSAIRAMQEKRFLMQKMIELLDAEGDEAQAAQQRAQIHQLEQQEALLHTLVDPPP